MIKCNNGELLIEGIKGQVALEFLQICDEVIANHSELFLAILDTRHEAIDNALASVNPNDLTIATAIYSHIPFGGSEHDRA